MAIVQRDPHGMPAVTRDRAIRQAIAVDRRLSGQSEGQLAAAAAALAKAGQPDAARILSGPVSDQEALHGLLGRLQALGLELVEVRRLPNQ